MMEHSGEPPRDGVGPRESFELDSPSRYDENGRSSSNYSEDEDEIPLVGGIHHAHEEDRANAIWHRVLYVAALSIAIMVGAILMVPSKTVAEPQLQCELDVTRNTSWTTYLHMVENSQSSRCDDLSPSCLCANPLLGQKPVNYVETWDYTASINLEYIKNASGRELDVVLLGDSLIEHWHGTDLGQPKEMFADNVAVYEQLFDTAKGAEVDGLALGIGGDRCPQVLYRLQHGELVPSPAVWWILVGTNDKGGDRCSNENVIAGIVNLVRYILEEKPEAFVVVNSLLPRGNENRLFWWDDYTAINQALECYATGTDRVEFFNATSLFVTPDGGVNETLLPDELHSTELGSWVWGRAIVGKVQEILSSIP